MQKVDIGHGRGWLAPPAAASLARLDADMLDAFGQRADINEAGRSREQADKNYADWIAYSTGRGPKAAYALRADKSVHVPGMAADSDDWYTPAKAAKWRDHGWRQTALYPNNPKKNEPWHGEYFPHLDSHRNDPAPIIQSEEDDDMMKQIRHPNGTINLVDEFGSDSLLDLADPGISLADLTAAVTRVLGPAEDVSKREFDVANSVLNNRWAHKKAEIVAGVVAALKGEA